MEITYSKPAVKSIKELNNPHKQRIKTAIENIPLGDIRKLQGYKNITPPLPDEKEAIIRGEAAYKAGEIYSHDEVWN